MKVFSFLFLIVLAGFAKAADAPPTNKEISKEASTSAATEMTLCAAFFTHVSHGIRDPNVSGASEAADNALKKAASLMQAAVMVFEVTRGKELAERLAVASWETFLSTMADEIENDGSNAAILTAKYMDRCFWVLENPDKLMAQKVLDTFAKYGLEAPKEYDGLLPQ